jgi:glutathione S-transferase
MRQVPVLVLPSGEIMTESAAMLIWLADHYPDAGLAETPRAETAILDRTAERIAQCCGS